MAINYTKLADTALRLIEENGRDVTFRRLNRTTVDDVAKPWRGTATPRTTVAASLTAKAVVVSPGQGAALGIVTADSELVRRSDEILVVALGSTSTVDLATYDEVLDGTELFKIGVVETLKPADTTLLYVIGVTR